MAVKSKYKVPSQAEVARQSKRYRPELSLTVKDIDESFVKDGQVIFEDQEFSKELPKIVINSISVSDEFEVETYIENDKMHIRFKSSSNSNIKNGYVPGYVELVMDTYEDLLKLTNNTYTRNGISQSDQGLHIEKLLNQNSLYKKVATVGVVASVVGAASYFISKILHRE